MMFDGKEGKLTCTDFSCTLLYISAYSGAHDSGELAPGEFQGAQYTVTVEFYFRNFFKNVINHLAGEKLPY